MRKLQALYRPSSVNMRGRNGEIEDGYRAKSIEPQEQNEQFSYYSEKKIY